MIAEMQTFEWVLIGLGSVVLIVALITVARELSRREKLVSKEEDKEHDNM